MGQKTLVESSKRHPHRKRKMPGWASGHFEESLESLTNLVNVIGASERGIHVLRAMPHAVKALAKYRGNAESSAMSKQLQLAEQQSALANAEIKRDFPVLHGFAVVALWSWLEHCVKGLVTLWLLHRPEAVRVPAIQKLRVKLGDYIGLDSKEQAQFLVDLLEQDMASPLRRGANRFESLLDPFGLSGALSRECTRSLFELQQVRNAFAHRNGRADRRLCRECAWLKYKTGKPVQVSGEMLRNYTNASGEFLVALIHRVGGIYVPDVSASSKASPNASLPPSAKVTNSPHTTSQPGTV